MKDLIDRQAAIEAMMAEVDDKDRPNVELRWWNMGLTRASKILEQLPSAEPKTGHWIKISPAGIYECSQCGQNVMTGDIEVYAYCHHCGAYMKEDTDETD